MRLSRFFLVLSCAAAIVGCSTGPQSTNNLGLRFFQNGELVSLDTSEPGVAQVRLARTSFQVEAPGSLFDGEEPGFIAVIAGDEAALGPLIPSCARADHTPMFGAGQTMALPREPLPRLFTTTVSPASGVNPAYTGYNLMAEETLPSEPAPPQGWGKRFTVSQIAIPRADVNLIERADEILLIFYSSHPSLTGPCEDAQPQAGTSRRAYPRRISTRRMDAVRLVFED